MTGVHGYAHVRIARTGERRELRVAVRAPGPAVNQDDAVRVGKVVWQRDRAAANSGTSRRGTAGHCAVGTSASFRISGGASRHGKLVAAWQADEAMVECG